MNLTRSFGQVNTRFFCDMFISYLLMYTVSFCMTMQSINILYYTVTVIEFFMGQIQDAQDMSTPCPRHIPDTSNMSYIHRGQK